MRGKRSTYLRSYCGEYYCCCCSCCHWNISTDCLLTWQFTVIHHPYCVVPLAFPIRGPLVTLFRTGMVILIDIEVATATWLVTLSYHVVWVVNTLSFSCPLFTCCVIELVLTFWNNIGGSTIRMILDNCNIDSSTVRIILDTCNTVLFSILVYMSAVLLDFLS